MSVYANIHVTAQCEEDLASFVRLCSNIQWAGDRGAGCNIPVFVDGDGSGRYQFSIDSEKGMQLIKSAEPSDKKLWLGE